MRLFSHRRRPVHLGSFPLERLPRAETVTGPATGVQPTDPEPAGGDCIANAMPEYQALFARFLDGKVAPARAPIPDDPIVRAHNLKAAMRASMRGAETAGVMAAHLRRLGYPARSQTNADSDILQIPPTLMAGLGELSRIGELVLSPFVGPRFKTVVLTTDLPMTVDRPIDFGLQDFCERCNKCARECPCNAIPFGPKVMFNGYEMWKPDVEKCAKYRVTNAKGSACGRCMKTCPYNTEGLLAHRLFLWLAINVPWSRGWIARLDDKVGNGAINRAKKWWFDLEMVDGASVTPKGVNERGLDLDAVKRAKTQALALFPPEVSPPPGAREPVEPDRAAGIKAYASAESPAAARARIARR